MESKSVTFFNKLSLIIFLITIFTSLFFFIPGTSIALEAIKGFFISIGVSLSLLFWLIAQLINGKIKIPNDRLVLLGAIVPVSFLISSLFSLSHYSSFFGAGFEVGTFGSMLILFIIFFLSAIHFQTEKRIWSFLGVIFIGAIILSVFELLNIFVGLEHLFPGFFQGIPSSNLVGSWNNFISLFGVVVLLLVFTLEFLKTKRIFLLIQYLLLIISLFFLIVISVPLVWLLVAIFSAIIFVYSLSVQGADVKIIYGLNNKRKFPIVSLVVVCLSVAFIIGSSSINGVVSRYINIPSIDLRPAVGATTEIVTKSLEHNLILGTGPNTFSIDWSLWQPPKIIESFFWNADFSSGSSFLYTTLATTGLLGFFTLLLFIIILFIRGIQSLKVALQNPLINYFVGVIFITTFYSWIMIIFNNPNIIIMMMAFLSSGTLIGILVYKKVILKKEIFYLDRPRNIFWGTFGLTVLIMGTVFLMSIYVSKLTSIVYFSKSSNKEMTIEALSRSEKMISKAISFDKNEAYYRSLSQVYLQEIGVTLRNKDINPEFLKLDLQRLVLLAKDNAEWAINQNPKNYVNYLNLGNVYSSLSTLMVKDSYQNSILAFDKARELAPRNPLILLARAQLELFNKNNDKAKDFAEQALEMKKDYREAQIFLSQITNNAPSN